MQNETIYHVFLRTAYAALQGEEIAPPIEEGYVKTLYLLAHRHNMVGILWPAVSKWEGIDPHVKSAWEKAALGASFHAVRQEYETERVCAALAEAGIPYVGLKGYVLRRIYPKTVQRSSADVDIYFPEEKREEVRHVMLRLGYEAGDCGTNHDTYLYNHVNMEMHHALLAHSDRLFPYYQNMWERLIPVSEAEYRMTAEDFFIFQCNHARSHMEGGGTGLRTLLDHEVWRCYATEMDRDYLQAEFQKLGMTKFVAMMDRLADIAFHGAEETADDALLLEYICSSGAYGTGVQGAAMKGGDLSHGKSRHAARLRYIWRRMFPSYGFMRGLFPVLGKCPILMPFFWVVRWLRAVFCRRDTVARELNSLNQLSEQDVGRAERVRTLMGLDEEGEA